MSRQIIQTNGPGRVRAIRRQIFVSVLLVVLLALGVFLVLEHTVLAPHVHPHALTSPLLHPKLRGGFVVARMSALLLVS